MTISDLEKMKFFLMYSKTFSFPLRRSGLSIFIATLQLPVLMKELFTDGQVQILKAAWDTDEGNDVNGMQQSALAAQPLP